MTEDDPPKLLNWNKVHELVIYQVNEAVEGVGICDVDWFLRDSSVVLLEQPPPMTSDGVEKHLKTASGAHTPLLTLSSPHLLVLNANDNCAAKTRPPIAAIQEGDSRSVLSGSTNALPSHTPKRCGSASSNASSGTTASNGSVSSGRFFSKLKSILQRSDSSTASSLSAPLGRPDSMLENKYEKPGIPSPQHSASQNPADSRSFFSADNERPRMSLDTEDPQLSEYIRLFQQDNKRGRKTLNSAEPKPHTTYTACPFSRSPRQFEKGKLSSLFRRRSLSAAVSTSPVKTDAKAIHTSSADTTPPTTPASKSLATLPKLKPLKHVAFHPLTFLIDPPQQIPSRNPRKGNVEVLPLGQVHVHPLTEADKLAIAKSLHSYGGGLVVGGTGAFSLTRKEPKNGENPNQDQDVAEEEPAIEAHAQSLGIDKLMVHSVNQTGYTAGVKKMSLNLIYSRCCHLREILPIPGIAKQIPKGSMAPLPFLQFRNPKPIMIEVETFADFIRIAPIICISLDGISLSYEQLKVLLSAMSAKTQLEKLSLRNTPLDTEGWALLCWFLSCNKAINKLDITQFAPLAVVKKKKKKKPEEEAVVRMVCNKENRSDMDWMMFTVALITRGGIEELILTGCCITDSHVFETLIRRAISIRTVKLGLAYNQLSPAQLHVVLESYLMSPKTRGLDLGYNDFLLPAFLQIIVELYKRDTWSEKMAASQLGFLSLNATNLRFTALFKDVAENFLAAVPNLKYLDMSNNPKLFGNDSALSVDDTSTDSRAKCRTDSSRSDIKTDSSRTDSKGDSGADKNETARVTPEVINSFFCSLLPRFKTLRRFHSDNNGLSSQSLSNLFEIVPFCKSLSYLSIVGNHMDFYSAAALIQCLKNSNTIMVDGDFLSLPESLRERIGSYSMRNMENYYNKNVPKKTDHGTGNERESLADQLNQLLLISNQGKLDINLPSFKLFTARTQRYRQELQGSIQDLFALQYSGDLSTEGKEALIRLLFVDSSLERGLQLIDKSLVDHDENITTSDILNMNLAEDEKNLVKNTAHDKAVNDTSDQPDPLPHVNPASLPISRNQSSATLASLDKEEGSVMKFARVTNKEALLDKFDNLSGEEIRQKMLNFNLLELDTLIDTINSARKRGVCFKQVFNDNYFMDTFRDDLRQRLNNLKRYAASNCKEKCPMLLQEQEIDLSRSGDGDDECGSKDINETYDRILSKFNK